MYFSSPLQPFLKWSASIPAVALLLKQSQGASGRAIASLLGISSFKAHQTLKFLVAQGMLKETIVGRSHLYRVNEDHILVQGMILPLLRFQERLFEEVGKDIVKSLTPKPISVILYGSVARGEEGPQSDLDLLLVYENKDKKAVGPIRESDLFMEKISRKYGNPVSVRRSLLSDFQERFSKRNTLIVNIIKEGKVIFGKSMMELLSHGR